MTTLDTDAERRDWLQGYEFALRNLSDEAVQADLARVRAESDTHGSDGQSGQPRTVRESGAPTTTAATVLTVRVERDTLDGGFVVRAAEAPGCVTQGETIPEALQNFADAFTDWAIARAVRAMAVPS